MVAAGAGQDIVINRPIVAGKAKRPASGGGFTVMLFFVFMLTYFALFLLMFCTVATTLGGLFLLSIALTLTISGYLAGA